MFDVNFIFEIIFIFEVVIIFEIIFIFEVIFILRGWSDPLPRSPKIKAKLVFIALFSLKKLVLKTFKKRQTKQTLLNFSWSEYNLTLFPPRHKIKTATQEPGHWLKACI